MIETKAVFSDAANEREERNRRLAYEAAVDGIVVLENDGTLPLAPCPVALFGAGATYTIKGGTGSGEVNVRSEVNVLEGLENAGFTVTTKGWIDRYDAQWKEGKERYIKEARKVLLHPSLKAITNIIASEFRYPVGDVVTPAEIGSADACVYVIARQSGEGKDRMDEPGSFRLESAEVENIRRCAEGFERFVLVINAGAPMDLSPLEGIEGINAVVFMGQLGMEGGNALADVLSGKRYPSGKLAVTWPKSYADVPFGGEFGPYAPDEDHAPYKEGIYVGYRYYDSFDVAPRYAFGYGLGYTSFSVSTREVSVTGDGASVAVLVENAGEALGREVVQVYASCPHTTSHGEYQRLVGFAKTPELAAGETAELAVAFSLSSLASYDEASATTYLDAGDYVIRVGASSRDTTPVAVIRLGEKAVVSSHKNLCGAAAPVAELASAKSIADEAQGLPVIDVDATAVKTVSFGYDRPRERFSDATETYLDGFGTGDMAKFCAGTGLFGEKRGFSVPGAVGHTTTDYLDRGIPNIELCDGPAGVRLQRRSGVNKKGEVKAIDASFSFYEILPKALARLMLADSEKDTVIYQFVTGFPVAAMVAQTWDVELAERIGRAVSEEMVEYGVTYWLAPALNIVRNPLCGRNFEYYSEDPLVSGKIAAAVTRGVQEAPGCYATIKHFAVNNQEEMRNTVSSDVDERALREIYLRGFEIAVREGHPRSVMTAYNKVNGTYCPNSRELCTDILRSEWGFDGVVMTDWLSTGKGRADVATAIEAGVDLIMPGGKGDVRTIARSAGKGLISARALRTACGRVLEATLEARPEA